MRIWGGSKWIEGSLGPEGNISDRRVSSGSVYTRLGPICSFGLIQEQFCIYFWAFSTWEEHQYWWRLPVGPGVETHKQTRGHNTHRNIKSKGKPEEEPFAPPRSVYSFHLGVHKKETKTSPSFHSSNPSKNYSQFPNFPTQFIFTYPFSLSRFLKFIQNSIYNHSFSFSDTHRSSICSVNRQSEKPTTSSP
ncbi:unnamed protein product [Lactuca saligna]|uniref:Uncharacterized protein n=1 Tax=Lactuca saligna TaxID=75948 RepID=A0AA35YAX9_LACSI|nr:unnamed protein product [Lactuca saligna]